MQKTLRRLAALTIAGVGVAGGAQAQEEVTLNWALWDWTATAYYEPLIEAYEAANPNVNIEYIDLGSTDYQTVLQTQLAGGADEFDVITIKDIPGYANLVSANLLLPLDDYMEAEGIDPAAYGGVVEALELDGNVYALPFRSDFWLLYYNKDLFDNAGVEYPDNDMTLAELDEKARAVTSGFGPDKVYGTHYHVWRSTVQLPGILDGEHTLVDGEYDFLKPHYERVLALQEDGIIQSYASLKTSNTHYSGPFYNAQIATLPMGSWFIGTQIAKVKSGESKAVNWGVVKFPRPEGVEAGATAATITALGVAANSSKQDAALDFVKFVAGPEGAAVIAQTGTFPALITDDVLATITSTEGFPEDEASREALVTTKRYLEMPVSPIAPQIEVVLNRAHDAIMTDNVSIDEGIEEMNRGVAELQ
ncbi:MAG TPA: extracellular solute-binding protein [Devosiaceae bacterium]|jgi:multiple sugar transport system substrate-binding protein|nr:extracellular solute-binding protein [Devosiaceae bacterium]